MIVITTPTGKIGSQVLARLLATTEEPLRLVARDPARLPASFGDRAEVVAGSHGDPGVIGRALKDADALFWLTPPPWRAGRLQDGMEGLARPAAGAVARHGVGHVVTISNLGRGVPGDAGVATHAHAVDDLFAATGAACRALTLPGFFDNLLGDAAALHGQGRFYGPLDRALKVPMVATADIAAVAAGLLADRSWTGQADRPVLGPEDLSMDDVAAAVSGALARRVEYVQVSLDDFRAALLGHGASPAMADGMAAMMAAKNAGLDNARARTPDSASPTSLADWAAAVLAPAVAG